MRTFYRNVKQMCIHVALWSASHKHLAHITVFRNQHMHVWVMPDDNSPLLKMPSNLAESYSVTLAAHVRLTIRDGSIYGGIRTCGSLAGILHNRISRALDLLEDNIFDWSNRSLTELWWGQSQFFYNIVNNFLRYKTKCFTSISINTMSNKIYFLK